MAKKANNAPAFVPFLIITVGLLASVAFFVLHFGAKKQETPVVDVYDALVAPVDLPSLKSKAQIKSEYIGEMNTLLADTAAFEGEVVGLYSHIEDRMLSVRVPYDMLDPHLEAVLNVRDLRKNTQDDLETEREQLVGFLKDMLSVQ